MVVKIATNNHKISNLVDYLKREAMALKRLDNLHIVRLLDSGNFGGAYFLVLEYIHGMDLVSCYKKKWPFSLDICISIGVDILDGLKAMHEQGFVHRDIKPDNLLVTRVGVKIIDLGLVRFISAAGRRMKRLTSPGCTMGTPSYMSPEQLCGFADFDGRCDLYVCGIVLYELLTGVLPFRRLPEKGQFVEYWKPPLRPFPKVFAPVDVPEKVQAIVWKALKADPNLRYQTAEEMRMALLAELGSYTKIYVP